jgi:hypothetical protein
LVFITYLDRLVQGRAVDLDMAAVQGKVAVQGRVADQVVVQREVLFCK